jgi:hypothetical protein
MRNKNVLRMGIAVLLYAIFLSGCVTSKRAPEIRNRLAADTELQLNGTADEVEAYVRYEVEQRANVAFSNVTAQYNTVLASIQKTYAEDPAGMTKKAAEAGVAYARGMERTRINMENEAQRLLAMADKIRGGAGAVRAVNQMATDEIAVRDQVFQDFIKSGAMETIKALLLELQNKYMNSTGGAK